MMRTGALALLMLIAACNRTDGGGNGAAGTGNGSALSGTGEQSDAAATLALAASGEGNCSARWEGQPATVQQVLERSSALLDRAIAQVGGIANLTEEALPTVAVTAPASLPFACADMFLSAVRRGAVPGVLLSPGEAGDAALADFTLSDIGAPPPSVILVIGRGGSLTWNGEAIGLDAIPERLRQLGGGGASEIEAPPGELELRPAREATFGEVHAVLRAVRAGHVRAALLLPSVPPMRPSAPPPPMPTMPPMPGNQAAP